MSGSSDRSATVGNQPNDPGTTASACCSSSSGSASWRSRFSVTDRAEPAADRGRDAAHRVLAEFATGEADRAEAAEVVAMMEDPCAAG